MSYFIVSHSVEDFDAWKKVYDSFEPTRLKFSIREHYALQSVEDKNSVVVVGEGSLENIKKFLASDDLKNGMANAGVIGSPTLFIGENKRD